MWWGTAFRCLFATCLVCATHLLSWVMLLYLNQVPYLCCVIPLALGYIDGAWVGLLVLVRVLLWGTDLFCVFHALGISSNGQYFYALAIIASVCCFLRSLYQSRLIHGGLASLCCWALYSDADCCLVGTVQLFTWATFVHYNHFATHLFIQLCSHPYATLCHGGLAGLGHQALHSGSDRFGGLCHWVPPPSGLLWWIGGLFGRTSFCCTTFPPFLNFFYFLLLFFFCHMGDPWWPTWPLLHCLPLPCRSAYHIALRTTLLYPTRLLGSMHCFCVHFGKPHQVFGFHALPPEAQYYTMPGSMHCCCGHIVIPCRVAGFLALLWWAYCYAVPGCWVPCTAARWTLV